MENPTTIDEFKMWKVERLKKFLRERNLKVSGRKDELVALAYAAVQMNIPQVADAREQRSEDYTAILTVGDDVVPDPLKDLADGWEGETSMGKWPPCMYFDIAEYLTNIDNIDLGRRLLSDYKDGKSYSYLESGWLGEVFYHNIEESSKYCFLRAECRPSQRINNIPWKAWICLEKSTGKILRGYCSCFAGLGSTCNHFGAVLFKVDLAWRMGGTRQSVTTQQCSWNRYGAKKEVEPKQISEMEWSKPHFSKHGMQSPINPVERQLFNPILHRKAPSTLGTLTNVLMPTCPGACFLQYAHEGKPPASYPPESGFNVSESVEVAATPHITSAIAELASGFDTAEAFLDSLPTLISDEVARIEIETRGQASNDTWIAQRRDRITASKVHAVVTRVRTIRASETEVDTSGLVKLISGASSPSPDLPALKYGREMEGQARKRYIEVMRETHNQSVRVMECGLFVHPDQMYLAATPDGIVSCKCCDTGLLEIKCPLSASHLVPSSDCVPYLMDDNGRIRLKRSHKYYYQVQMQLGVTGRKWCDFFVYTSHGHAAERIVFDIKIWEEIQMSTKYFFESVYVHHLFHRTD